MNISVLIGLIVAFGGVLLGYLHEGGNPASLLLLSPMMIVFGGTCGTVIFSFGLSNTAAAMKFFAQSLFSKNNPNPDKLIEILVQIAERCRKEGILSLQSMVDDANISGDQYTILKEGMVMVMDNKDIDQIQDALETDIATYTASRTQYIEVFEGASGYAPTMGMIGTVMGLVQVLSNMEDAKQLTASIAVAFIATLYGVVFANLLFLPMANHLKSYLKRQKVFKQMIADGITLIAKGELPRSLSNRLAIYHQMFPKGDKKYKSGVLN